MNPPAGRGKLLVALAKWSVAVASLAYLFRSGKLSLRGLSLSPDHLSSYGLAAACLLAVIGIVSVRHWLLLRGLGISLRLVEVLRLSLVGAFFNTFLLGGVGGDVVKVAYLGRGGRGFVRPTASVTVDRAFGLTALLLLGCGALLLGSRAADPRLQDLRLSSFGVLGAVALSALTGAIALARGRASALAVWAVMVGVAAARLARAGEGKVGWAMLACAGFASLACLIVLPSLQPGRTLERAAQRAPFARPVLSFVQAIIAFRGHSPTLAAALALSLAAQGGSLLTLYLLATTVSPASFLDVLFAGPAALVANMLPVPGGGLGVGELAFENTLGLCQTVEGARVAGGAQAFLLFRLFLIAAGLLGLPVYLRGRLELTQAQTELAQLSEGSPPCG